jgi:hypothetical protein
VAAVYTILEGDWRLCPPTFPSAPADVVGIRFALGSSVPTPNGGTQGGLAYFLEQGPTAPAPGAGFAYEVVKVLPGMIQMNIIQEGGFIPCTFTYSLFPKQLEMTLTSTDRVHLVATGGPHLMWHDPTAGTFEAWFLAGTGVTGTGNLDAICAAGDGCSSEFKVIPNTLDNTMLFHNPTTGVVRTWEFDGSGHVFNEFNLDISGVGCGASPCTLGWNLIGRVSFPTPCTPPPPNCDPSVDLCICAPNPPREGLLWHNPSAGYLEYWMLSGNTVTSVVPVSVPCGPADGCSTTWSPILTADFNGDGSSDLLWYNPTSGQIQYWQLSASGDVNGNPFLTTTLDATQGWRIVGAADANGDGNVDLLWHHASGGWLRYWYLDGHGNVIDQANLSMTCDAASGCSSEQTAIGFVNFPLAPP